MSEPDLESEWDVNPEEVEKIPSQGGKLELENILEPISTVMRRDVGTVTGDKTIQEAVGLMVRGHYGCVLVVQGRRLRGILSERDVTTRVVHPRLDASQENVSDHMTAEPETLRPTDAIAYALNLMAIGGFRHVPITDARGDLQGILSLRDVAGLMVEQFREEILTLPPPASRGPKTQHGG